MMEQESIHTLTQRLANLDQVIASFQTEANAVSSNGFAGPQNLTDLQAKRALLAQKLAEMQSAV